MTELKGSRFERAVRAEWPAEAEQVLGLIRGTVDPEEYHDVARWIGQCYHRPSTHELIACALNQVLGMHGVEAIPAEACNVFAPPVVEYLNAGDTYAMTLVYIGGRWSVGSWGDAVERLEAGADA